MSGWAAELAGDNARNARLAFIFHSVLLYLSLSPSFTPAHPLTPLLTVLPACFILSVCSRWYQPCPAFDHIWVFVISPGGRSWLCGAIATDQRIVCHCVCMQHHAFLSVSLIPHANSTFGLYKFICVGKFTPATPHFLIRPSYFPPPFPTLGTPQAGF